jgi:hypothetical protein
MPVESANPSHAAAFCNLYKWLQGNDFLSIKKNRQDPLIIMNARKLASILDQKPRTRTLASLVCLWILWDEIIRHPTKEKA